MAHNVKCYYCGNTFNRDKIEAIKVNGNRYAHKDCFLKEDQGKDKDTKDLEELVEYIKQLFNYKTLPISIKKQIDKYRSEFNYTYSGMKKSLVYFYEVKNGNLEKSQGRIGIIPYVYTDAYNYFYSLWEAQQKNKDKIIADYLPQEFIIRISPPKRQPMKPLKKFFSFLDEEEEK